MNFHSLRKLAQHGMVLGLPLIDQAEQLCDSCLVGKQRRTPFPAKAHYRAKELLDLVHGDLCGPITPSTPGGKRYFLLLVDDLSRFMWLVLLGAKDEAATAVKRFQAMVEVESGRKLRVLRTDRGGEFTSIEFGEYCADRGVQRHLTAPYSPQQNGVVERRNQTVVQMARSMIKAMGVPNRFWGEAVTTAVFILNRAPTKAVEGKTPYEAWYGERPTVNFFRTFGCVAHVKVVKPNLKKLEDRSVPMVFLGYVDGGKSYKVYNPVINTVHVTRDAIFEETARWNWTREDVLTPLNLDDSFIIQPTTYKVPVAEPSKRSELADPSKQSRASSRHQLQLLPSTTWGVFQWGICHRAINLTLTSTLLGLNDIAASRMSTIPQRRWNQRISRSCS